MKVIFSILITYVSLFGFAQCDEREIFFSRIPDSKQKRILLGEQQDELFSKLFEDISKKEVKLGKERGWKGLFERRPHFIFMRIVDGENQMLIFSVDGELLTRSLTRVLDLELQKAATLFLLETCT